MRSWRNNSATRKRTPNGLSYTLGAWKKGACNIMANAMNINQWHVWTKYKKILKLVTDEIKAFFTQVIGNKILTNFKSLYAYILQHSEIIEINPNRGDGGGANLPQFWIFFYFFPYIAGLISILSFSISWGFSHKSYIVLSIIALFSAHLFFLSINFGIVKPPYFFV